MTPAQERLRLAASRVLGLVDLDPSSPTAGCADRNYWHYQDGKGFAVGSFQMGMLGLWGASVILTDSRTAYEQGAKLMLRNWERQIQKKGSLDEYFLNQKSFCATAYTTLAAAVTARGLGVSAHNSIQRALKHLETDRNRPNSANQTLAARIAWDLSNNETGTEAPFRLAPSEQGWLSEYGGFDLGYSLKCLDLITLALLTISDATRRDYYEKLAASLISFLSTVVLDFTFAPELGSRGNPHRLLGGLSVFAHAGQQEARTLLTELRDEKRFPALVPAECCDDKYLSFFHLTSLLLETKAEGAQIGGLAGWVKPHTLTRQATEPLWQSGSVVFCKNDKLRAAISPYRGGSYLIEGPQCRKQNGGYTCIKGKTEYCSLPESPAAAVIELGQGKFEIRQQILVSPRKTSVSLTQSLIFPFALKIALSIPMVGTLLRNKIYGEKNKSQQSVLLGVRTFSVSPDTIVVTEDFDPRFENIVAFSHWNFTDGHATRMHFVPESVFEPTSGKPIA